MMSPLIAPLRKERLDIPAWAAISSNDGGAPVQHSIQAWIRFNFSERAGESCIHFTGWGIKGDLYPVKAPKESAADPRSSV